MHVLIIDDHWVSRAGVRHLLSLLDDDITLSEASGAEEALEIVSRKRDLDLILLDLLMPGMDPFDGLAALHRKCPGVPIVVFSVNEQRKDVLRTIDLGAMGYIPKSSDADEILSALKQVLSGNMYLPRGLMSKPQPDDLETDLDPNNVGAYRDLTNGLTKRQLEVFHLLAKGLSNREIASALDVSEHTVRIHISAILRTLKVANRTQAALIAASKLASK
jgi:DNA-binding NarL/FixJ family response regulator